MVFQDPFTSLHPMLSVGRQLTEHVRLHLGLAGGAAEARAVELLEEVRLPDPRAGARPLPAPVLRRDAPAHCDRDRARLPAQAADRRRADDRARRDRAGGDPAAPRPPAARARPGSDPDHPRPRRPLGHRRPRRDLLRRPRRRVRAAEGRAAAPAPPVHQGAARCAPAPGGDQGAAARRNRGYAAGPGPTSRPAAPSIRGARTQ